MAFVLKVYCDGEIYRLRLSANKEFTHEAVAAALAMLPQPAPSFQAKYQDEEDDLCVLCEGTFTDFVCVSEQKAPGKRICKVRLVPLPARTSSKCEASSARSPVSPNPSPDDYRSSSGSSSDDSSSGDDGEGPPKHLAGGFVEALCAEYVRGESRGVGRFLRREHVPRKMARRAQSVERRVQRHREPAAAIAKLARRWRVPCPEACREAADAVAAAAANKIVVEPPCVRRFLAALVDEYVRGEDNGVGKFFKVHRELPHRVKKQLERLEDGVRSDREPHRSIARLAQCWGLPCPEGCDDHELPPGGPFVARGFLAALRAQYLAGQEGAVGEFYKNLRGALKHRLELIEERLVECKGDFDATIALLAEAWDLDADVAEHQHEQEKAAAGPFEEEHA